VTKSDETAVVLFQLMVHLHDMMTAVCSKKQCFNFDPEDVGCKRFQNVGIHLKADMVPQPGRQHSSRVNAVKNLQSLM
jgi:hypothetical protein